MRIVIEFDYNPERPMLLGEAVQEIATEWGLVNGPGPGEPYGVFTILASSEKGTVREEF